MKKVTSKNVFLLFTLFYGDVLKEFITASPRAIFNINCVVVSDRPWE